MCVPSNLSISHSNCVHNQLQVRLGNVALRRRLGAGLEGAREVLSAAGFTAQAPPAAGGGGDPHQQQGSEVVMAWTRRDPGLVWLALSALQTAEEAVQAQLAKGAAAAP